MIGKHRPGGGPAGVREVPNVDRGRYERTEHTADEAFRLSAGDLSGIFVAGARALLEVLTDPQKVEPRENRSIALAADDNESLLVAWLNELIYLFETQAMLFSEFEVNIRPGPNLEAVVRGEPRDPARHPVEAVVKAATFQDLAIRRAGDGWETKIVFDV